MTDRETNRQMDERNPPSLRFCPFLNIPDSSKWKNPECFYTQTIKAVYSNNDNNNNNNNNNNDNDNNYNLYFERVTQEY